MPKATGKTIGLYLVSAICIVIIATALVIVLSPNKPTAQEQGSVAASTTKASDGAGGAQVVEIVNPNPESNSVLIASDKMVIHGIGNPNAPVVIHEFSSLTCPHCADFHKNTYEALKKKYIDTGKVYFKLTDFPLNRPALDASMVANCLPPERYFSFVQLLFTTQENWAFSQDYLNALKQNAKLAGMTDESFQACMENDALRQKIISGVEYAQKTYNIRATPTFIFNDTASRRLEGEQPLATFGRMVDDLASGKPGSTNE